MYLTKIKIIIGYVGLLYSLRNKSLWLYNPAIPNKKEAIYGYKASLYQRFQSKLNKNGELLSIWMGTDSRSFLWPQDKGIELVCRHLFLAIAQNQISFRGVNIDVIFY